MAADPAAETVAYSDPVKGGPDCLRWPADTPAAAVSRACLLADGHVPLAGCRRGCGIVALGRRVSASSPWQSWSSPSQSHPSSLSHTRRGRSAWRRQADWCASESGGTVPHVAKRVRECRSSGQVCGVPSACGSTSLTRDVCFASAFDSCMSRSLKVCRQCLGWRLGRHRDSGAGRRWLPLNW